MKHYPSPDTGTDASVFAVGNGRALMYLNGVEISQCVGSPYSSPSAFSMRPVDGSKWDSRVSDNIAVHTAGEGTVTDCAAFYDAHLARVWELESPVRWEIDLKGHPAGTLGGLFENYISYLVRIPSGADVFGGYTTTADRYMLLLFSPQASVTATETGLDVVTCGRGCMLIAPGKDLGECIDNGRAAVKVGGSDTLFGARRDNAAYTAARRKRVKPLKDHPLSVTALSCADDIAWLIRSQQGAEGGIMAGTNYHLAYIRDEYGAGRGLLAAGCLDEARKILSFYSDTFGACGMLANAQGIGEKGMFHPHENDESEITGYLLHQAADYLDAASDAAFVRGLFPMLDWALQKQIGALHNGMLPFNGDETYVAGGIVPRTVLDEGSLEATCLFISGARRYLAFRKAFSDVSTLTDKVNAALESNFFKHGIWYSNSPKRIEGLSYKPYRPGVCIGAGCRGGALSRVNIHTGNGLYLCTRCLSENASAPAPRHDEPIYAKSVTLADPYLRMNLLPSEYIKRETQAFLSEFRAFGYISTRSGGDRCLGLDWGLLLYAAKEAGLECEDLLKATLAARDDTGAWTEYYIHGKPRCTPCRPWESGVNIDSVINYLKI